MELFAEIFAWVMMGSIVLTILGMSIAESIKKHLLALNLTKVLIVEILIYFAVAIVCGILKVSLF